MTLAARSTRSRARTSTMQPAIVNQLADPVAKVSVRNICVVLLARPQEEAT